MARKLIGSLSATMVSCLDLALEHDGVLVRYQGGYWAPRGRIHPKLGGESYGSKTVEALVTRGVAEFTEWKDGRASRWPVAMKLKPENQWEHGHGNID